MVTALMAYVNRRFIGLPPSIGVMSIAPVILIGVEVILIKFSFAVVMPAITVIVVTLFDRLLTATAPVVSFRNSFSLPRRAWQVLAWGGLCGGISVALALSQPRGAMLIYRSPIRVRKNATARQMCGRRGK